MVADEVQICIWTPVQYLLYGVPVIVQAIDNVNTKNAVEQFFGIECETSTVCVEVSL